MKKFIFLLLALCTISIVQPSEANDNGAAPVWSSLIMPVVSAANVPAPYFAQQCINVPNANAADIRDTLCTYWGYSGNPADLTAKNEFVRAYMAKFMKDQFITAKQVQASDAARQTNIVVDIN